MICCLLIEFAEYIHLVLVGPLTQDMLLLHFSDIHDNRRAVDAVCNVAAKWRGAYVAITGDVCQTDSIASRRYDELPNPKIWLVRGNHDVLPKEQFGHLTRVQWQTPYFASLSNQIALIGLDSEQNFGDTRIEKQLQSIGVPDNADQKRALVVLHHQPYTVSKELILDWIKKNFPNITHIALLHGHQHHPPDFYAERSREHSGGVNILISNVYSANTKFCKKRTMGCANLFVIRDDGSMLVEPVFDHPDRASIKHCTEVANLERINHDGTTPAIRNTFVMVARPRRPATDDEAVVRLSQRSKSN